MGVGMAVRTHSNEFDLQVPGIGKVTDRIISQVGMVLMYVTVGGKTAAFSVL